MFSKKLFTFFCFFAFQIFSFNYVNGNEIDEDLIGDIVRIKNNKNIVLEETQNNNEITSDKKDDTQYNKKDSNKNIESKNIKKKKTNIDIKVVNAYDTDKGVAVKNLQEAYKFYIQKDYELAILYYKKSLKENPDGIEARFGLGVCYQFLHQYDQAIDSYLKLLEKNYSRKKIVSNLLLCLQHKSYKKSLEILSSIDEKILGYSDILAQIGIIYMKTNNNQKAILTLLKAYDIDPTNAIVAYDLGILFDRNKNIDNAKHFFDIAVKNNISSILEEQDNKRLIERIYELNEQIQNEIKKNKKSKN